MKRVVITGLGAITPIGIGKNDFWQGLLDCKSGVSGITSFDITDFSTKVGAEIKTFIPTDYLDKKESRRMDRFTQFAVTAAKEAVTDAGLDLEKIDLERAGVIVGSGIGGIQTIEEQYKVLNEKGPKKVSPFLVPMLIANMASGYISISLGLKGPNTTVVTACASGTHSIGDAFRIIQRDDADIMLAGGSEAPFTAIAVAGFCSVRAMTTRNDDPDRASRPFDKERDGFVMGEGAGVLVLESLEHALARDADIYAEVVGYGMSGDAYHVTAPQPEGKGAKKCMKLAIKDAAIDPQQIGYINAHGTSTEYNDKIETQGIKEVFGSHAYDLAVSSTKSMTGHLLGAAGGIEGVACALVLKEGVIPPTINYEFPDPECDLDYVPNKARKQKVNFVMTNSFGFGGTNACLIFKKY